MNKRFTRSTVLISGVLSLILTLGIARFAYTPLLPLMQIQTGLSDALGGWLATINYIGYILGAYIASVVSDIEIKDKLYRMGLIVAVATTLLMASTDNIYLWLLLRFFAGLSSAAGLLIGSSLLLNWLIKNGHRSELGIHFSGMGIGIALVSIIVQQTTLEFDWREQWVSLGVIGLLILIPAWRWLPRPNTYKTQLSKKQLKDNPPSRQFLKWLQFAYLCAGFGYVVSATFIVAIIERQPSLQGQGELTFLIIGIAAAPACIVWDLIARRVGVMNALLSAYLLQIIGIVLPAVTTNLFTILFSTLLFGSTFIGIVSLVLTMAGRYYPSNPARLMGVLTLSYGAAQIIGPAISGQIAEYSGSYNGALYMATAFMCAGSLAILKLRKI